MRLIHHHFTTIDSTNTWAKHHVDSFDPSAVTLVSADAQTAGRGRFKRGWVSPPNQNIYATYCVFLEKHRSDIGNLPQVAAIAIVQVLSTLKISAQLKWPNDVVVNHKKIAGILSESTLSSDQLCLFIGIGLNINMPLEILNTIDRPATSLLVESQQSFVVTDVLKLLTDQFLTHLSLFLKEGFSPFFPVYRSMLWQKTEAISFHDGLRVWEGKIENINFDGSLNLRLEDGMIKTFHAGEILF